MPGVDDLGVKLDAHREKQLKRLECNVGEKTLRTWLDTNGVQKVAKVSFDVNEVEVNPDLPGAVQTRVRAILDQYKHVFAGQQDSLPKPFATDPWSSSLWKTLSRRACLNRDGPSPRSKC